MTEIGDQITNPAICVVHTAKGQHIESTLAALLNPVDPRTFHQYRLPANANVELHYHDFDEYWWFVAGHPRVTLRSPGGTTMVLELEPGDMVACVRGVEHTLWADHELVYYQYSSVLAGNERQGHLTRQAKYPTLTGAT
jgi:mannose-6-phosphate isomerase-like protein (cupin superfamily)